MCFALLRPCLEESEKTENMFMISVVVARLLAFFFSFSTMRDGTSVEFQQAFSEDLRLLFLLFVWRYWVISATIVEGILHRVHRCEFHHVICHSSCPSRFPGDTFLWHLPSGAADFTMCHRLEDVSFIEPKHVQMSLIDPFLAPLCRRSARCVGESSRAVVHFHADSLSPWTRRETRSAARGAWAQARWSGLYVAYYFETYLEVAI